MQSAVYTQLFLWFHLSVASVRPSVRSTNRSPVYTSHAVPGWLSPTAVKSRHEIDHANNRNALNALILDAVVGRVRYVWPSIRASMQQAHPTREATFIARMGLSNSVQRIAHGWINGLFFVGRVVPFDLQTCRIFLQKCKTPKTFCGVLLHAFCLNWRRCAQQHPKYLVDFSTLKIFGYLDKVSSHYHEWVLKQRIFISYY